MQVGVDGREWPIWVPGSGDVHMQPAWVPGGGDMHMQPAWVPDGGTWIC